MPSDWSELSLKPPKFLQDALGVINPVVSALSVILDLSIAVLEITLFLLSFGVDAINAILKEAINLLETIINLIGSLGFAAYVFYPKEFKSEYATGYNGFLEDLAYSLTNPHDTNAPALASGAPFFAFSVAAGMTNFDMQKIKKIMEAFQSLLDTIGSFSLTSVLSSVVPQGPYDGVISPSWDKAQPGFVVTLELVSTEKTLSCPDFGDTTITDTNVKVTKSGAVTHISFAEPRMVSASESPIILPSTFGGYGRVHLIMAIPYGDPEAVKNPEAQSPVCDVVAIPVGDLKADGSPEIDMILYTYAGSQGVVLGYVEVDSSGKITKFDPEFRRIIPPNRVPDKNKTLINDQATMATTSSSNWRAGWKLRDWPAFRDSSETLFQILKKFKVPVGQDDSIELLKRILNYIKEYLTSIKRKLKQISDAFESLLTGLAAGIGFMWVTPWPTLVSSKDPFQLLPNSTFSITPDRITAGVPYPDIPTYPDITFNATAGYYTGINNVNFAIPAGTNFDMDIYRREAYVLNTAGRENNLVITLGFDDPTKEEPGVLNSAEVPELRVPSSEPARLQISTFGKEIHLTSSPNSILNIIGGSSKTGIESIEYSRIIQYFFPDGAATKLSVWSNKITPESGDILDKTGLLDYVRNEDGSLEGKVVENFYVPSNTAMRVTTKTLNRSYPASSIRDLIGFSDPQIPLSDLVDAGGDARKFIFPAAAATKVTLKVKDIKITGGTSISILGLQTTTNIENGELEGTPCFTFTGPACSFKISAKSTTITPLDSPFIRKVGISSFLSSDASIAGADSRKFSWEISQGINISVKDISGTTLYAGSTQFIVGGEDRNGFALANQLTASIRALPGTTGSEFCSFDENTGLFKVYFGGDATKVILSPTTLADKDVSKLLGLSYGEFTLTGGILQGGEPESYTVIAGDTLQLELGIELFSISPDVGKYTGTALAAHLKSKLNTSTTKLENISYNLGTGTFVISVDPSAYKWIEPLTISIPALSQATPTFLLSTLNSFFVGLSVQASFSFAGEKLVFTCAGMKKITFSNETGSAFSLLGLSSGEETVTNLYTAEIPKNFYFEESTKTLTGIKNRSIFAISMPIETRMSPQEVINHLSSSVPNLGVSYASKFLLSSLSELTLLDEQMLVMGPSSNVSVATILADITTFFNSSLTDTKTLVSTEDSKITIFYPDMTTLIFTSGPTVENLGSILGLNSFTGVQSFVTGEEYKPYYIDASNKDFSISLGSSIVNINIPEIGRALGSDLASNIASEVSSQKSISVSYNSYTGVFTFTLSTSGYTQINDAYIPIPPDTYTSLQLAAKISSGIMLYSSSSSVEIRYIRKKFIFLADKTVSATFSTPLGSKSLCEMIGFSIGQQTLISGRYTGQTTAPFSIESGLDTFVFNVGGTMFPCILPTSTGFESGESIAAKLQSSITSATGMTHSVSFNLSTNKFKVSPPTQGVKLVDNYSLILVGDSTYVSPSELANRINIAVQSDFPTLGLLAAYNTENNQFSFYMDGLSLLEFQPESFSYALAEMLGYSYTQLAANNSFVLADQELKNFTSSPYCNNLNIQLGKIIYNINLSTSFTLYTPQEYCAFLQAEIRFRSGRDTVVYYDAPANIIRFSPASNGEYFLNNALTTLFPAGDYLLPSDIVPLLNSISTAANYNSETFGYDEVSNKYFFNDPSGTTLGILVTSDNPDFNLSEALGMSGGEKILANKKVTFEEVKSYVIVAFENDIFNYFVNQQSSSFVIPPGAYTGASLAQKIKSLCTLEQFKDFTFQDQVFTLSSKEEGINYFSHTINYPTEVYGSPNLISLDLQDKIRDLSSDKDETVEYANSTFLISKEDIIGVLFSDPDKSVAPKILTILGFTEDKDFTNSSIILPSEVSIDDSGVPITEINLNRVTLEDGDVLFISNSTVIKDEGGDIIPLYSLSLGKKVVYTFATADSIIFDTVRPFYVTSTANRFVMDIDSLNNIDIVLETDAEPMSGQEMAEYLQDRIRKRLTSLSLRNIFYRWSLSVPDYISSLNPVNNRNLERTISDKDTELIRSTIKKIFFDGIGATNKNFIQSLFYSPQDPDVMKDIKDGLSSAMPSSQAALAAFSEVEKSLLLAPFNTLVDTVFTLFVNNSPLYTDPDSIVQELAPFVSSIIEDAARGNNLPLTALSPTVWNDKKKEFQTALLSSLDSIFKDKYFIELMCSYDTMGSFFKVTSPTFGYGSKINISVSAENDISQFLGLNIGIETEGTGNVRYIHRVTSTEVAAAVRLAMPDFAAYSFGIPFTREEYVVQDEIREADILYPHRYYDRDEVPRSASVIVHPYTEHFGPSARLTLTDKNNSPNVELGFPAFVTSEVGVDTFLGAFRLAGPPGAPEDTSDPAYIALMDSSYIVAAILVLVVPSPTDTLINPMMNTFKNIAGILGIQLPGG